MVLPSLDELEDHIHNAGLTVYASLVHLSGEIEDSYKKLWEDVSRFGPPIPSLQEIKEHIPNLGPFEVPARTSQVKLVSVKSSSSSSEWFSRHPWTTAGFLVGTIGLTGYSAYQWRAAARRRIMDIAHADRKQVVVVIGGDHPLGRDLIQQLESSGYIVITSAATLESAEAIERSASGYVRALILDPSQPSTVPIFIRSLMSTLSRRFPLNAAGDPYLSLATQPHIHSIISLLTAPLASHPVPFESLNLKEDYLPYLIRSHFTPLQAIQSLLAALRASPTHSRDHQHLEKTIMVCVPSIHSRVAVPYSGKETMSATSTVSAVEVLRRECNAATLLDRNAVGNVRVITVDIGLFTPQKAASTDIPNVAASWSRSEREAYEPSFKAVLKRGSKVMRRPIDPSVFASTVLEVISQGQISTCSPLAKQLGWVDFKNWLRGDRFSVGSGALTYMLASHLPSTILNFALALPFRLASFQKREEPVLPTERPLTPDAPAPVSSEEVTVDLESNPDVDPPPSVGGSWISIQESNKDTSG